MSSEQGPINHTETPEQKKWFEKEPEPGKARITYKPYRDADPFVVADVPVKSLFKRGWAAISGTISVELIETGKNEDGENSNYAKLKSYLYDHYDYENKTHGIRVPEDSPVRKLPGIKYEIPPQSGLSRVGVCLSEDELQTLQLPEENRFLVLNDIVSSKVYSIQRYFEDESLRLSDQRGEHEDAHFFRAQNLSEAIGANDISFLDTAAIEQFGIQPDPESPGYAAFTALQRKS